jgi:hypothetical protein
MVAPPGNPVPARPRPGGTAPGWTRGILAVIRGTFLGGGTKLGRFRFAWAILTSGASRGGGSRWPWARAGGIICLR